jgi:hypothetical protein
MVLVFGRMRGRRSILSPLAQACRGKTAHVRDRRLCSWPHPAPIIASRRRHAFMSKHLLHHRQVGAGVTLSRREVCRISCGLKGATPAAAARSRKIPATRSSASPRSPPRLPRTARPNNAPAPRPRTPAMRRRLPLDQKVGDRSIRSALSARIMMVNVSSSAYDLRSKRCWTGIELRPIGRVSIGANGLPGRVL